MLINLVLIFVNMIDKLDECSPQNHAVYAEGLFKLLDYVSEILPSIGDLYKNLI